MTSIQCIQEKLMSSRTQCRFGKNLTLIVSDYYSIALIVRCDISDLILASRSRMMMIIRNDQLIIGEIVFLHIGDHTVREEDTIRTTTESYHPWSRQRCKELVQIHSHSIRDIPRVAREFGNTKNTLK